ncbi:shikimate kinase [Calycomorphotria hydatis]|uniref:Shikimate kinase n=1 Tax=Calycomorphotria hydatis TaxID=2528027 RepID=A0A517T368_9PLAN|nr:shikimate kinase [Calycomorphotria hydatis]QDT62818.1 Shikimate kinase [Calycomorphotria hydatis]
MSRLPDNLILVGMPGSGKTTIGRPLAQRIGYKMVDTDDLIEAGEGMRLCEIQAKHSVTGFLKIEEAHAMSVSGTGQVISTGGSVVYSEPAMRHLKSIGTVVFLDVPLKELSERLADLGDRGVIIAPGHTLADLEAERRPLYERYADLTIKCENHPAGWIAAEIATHCLAGLG